MAFPLSGACKQSAAGRRIIRSMEKPSPEGLLGDRGDGWTSWSLSDARQIIPMLKDNLARGLHLLEPHDIDTGQPKRPPPLTH
jgi:hypothetical protein